MKVVLDCNVVISAGITNGVCREVLRYVLQYAVIVTTNTIEREYIDVIRRAKFRPYADAMMALFSEVQQAAFYVEPRLSGLSLPDKDDIPYIDAAITVAADFLITGNIKHFPARQYGTVEIVSPKEFLQRMATL
uniref:Putative toxin-antitoxin system toxin component, PIN family n=1 Tax=Candidatus Kentrum sp. FW TaxID=2126338 RepID=A0A450SSX4_9GAMM|nr:MAG: putative toxin-antitoxin system toxin component, PIN family [Candidatus Kentron sp. FW]VFJ64368.1 MAG: putative toxin-antitoxin system toxin component, PIN family [Candidatus Kentron sp. FW]